MDDTSNQMMDLAEMLDIALVWMDGCDGESIDSIVQDVQ